MYIENGCAWPKGVKGEMNIERIEKKRRRNRFIILIRGIVISVTFKCTKSRIKLPNNFV